MLAKGLAIAESSTSNFVHLWNFFREIEVQGADYPDKNLVVFQKRLSGWTGQVRRLLIR